MSVRKPQACLESVGPGQESRAEIVHDGFVGIILLVATLFYLFWGTW